MGQVTILQQRVQRRMQSGFTLVELSVVLVIVAFIVAGGLAIAVASVDKYPFDETQKKIATIERTLLNFRKAHNRLPCPAHSTVALNSAGFGKEADGPGDCTTGAVKASFGPTANVVAGMIPTQTLGLSDEYAFDGWGRRFLYVVDNRMTWRDPDSGQGAFIRYPIADDSVGAMIVKDLADSTRTSRAVYVIVSHGKNGHGAFMRDGQRSRVRADDALGVGVGTRELDNCDCDALVNTPLYPAAAPFPPIERTFYQQPIVEESVTPSADFDDIIVYKTRQTLRSGYE